MGHVIIEPVTCEQNYEFTFEPSVSTKAGIHPMVDIWNTCNDAESRFPYCTIGNIYNTGHEYADIGLLKRATAADSRKLIHIIAGLGHRMRIMTSSWPSSILKEKRKKRHQRQNRCVPPCRKHGWKHTFCSSSLLRPSFASQLGTVVPRELC